MAEPNTEKRKLDKRRLIAYWGAGVAVVLLDQITKVVVDWRFPLNYNQPVIPGIFDLVHVRNYGAAWGMFAGRTWLSMRPRPDQLPQRRWNSKWNQKDCRAS